MPNTSGFFFNDVHGSGKCRTLSECMELWVNAIEKNVEVFWSEEGLRYAVGE